MRELSKIEKYYVYAHYRPGDDIPFYIGKGSGKRAYLKRIRNPLWENVVRKNKKFDVRIILDNLNEYTAFCMEAMYINAYGRRDQGKGPLTNMSDGGEGPSGNIPWNKNKKDVYDEETKISMGADKVGKSSWNKDAITPEKTKDKQSISAFKRPKRDDAYSNKMREITIGKNTWAAGSRAIYNLETNVSKKLKYMEELPEGWAFGRGVKSNVVVIDNSGNETIYHTVKSASDALGISKDTIYSAIRNNSMLRSGMSFKTKQIIKTIVVTPQGTFKTVREAAQKTGWSEWAIRNRCCKEILGYKFVQV